MQICPACLTQNPSGAPHCRGCDGPLAAPPGPMQMASAEANLIHKAGGMERPGCLVLTGSWLLWGVPFLLGCLLAGAGIGGLLQGWEPFDSWRQALLYAAFLLPLMVVTVLGWIWICGMAVHRVTQNYLAARRQPPEPDASAPHRRPR